jgi:hypothetical protein
MTICILNAEKSGTARLSKTGSDEVVVMISVLMRVGEETSIGTLWDVTGGGAL